MNQIISDQLESLIEDITEEITLLSNVSAFLNEVISDISWVGFYLEKNNKLILGPFQGRVACTVIDLDKGVCGKAATNQEVEVVSDVHQFPGHIACDSRTNSEIVLPLVVSGKLYGVLDIDSTSFERFKEEEKQLLIKCSEVIVERLEKIL